MDDALRDGLTVYRSRSEGSQSRGTLGRAWRPQRPSVSIIPRKNPRRRAGDNRDGEPRKASCPVSSAQYQLWYIACVIGSKFRAMNRRLRICRTATRSKRSGRTVTLTGGRGRSLVDFKQKDCRANVRCCCIRPVWTLWRVSRLSYTPV